jgi:hypothetical protein
MVESWPLILTSWLFPLAFLPVLIKERFLHFQFELLASLFSAVYSHVHHQCSSPDMEWCPVPDLILYASDVYGGYLVAISALSIQIYYHPIYKRFPQIYTLFLVTATTLTLWMNLLYPDERMAMWVIGGFLAAIYTLVVLVRFFTHPPSLWHLLVTLELLSFMSAYVVRIMADNALQAGYSRTVYIYLHAAWHVLLAFSVFCSVASVFYLDRLIDYEPLPNHE